MRPTDMNLREQMRITDRELDRRADLLRISEKDGTLLRKSKPTIAEDLDLIVDEFYETLLKTHEIQQLIGDSETLARLKNHLRTYILTLFDGQYDGEYVLSRLRIGMVHKRIGVSPKLYVAAIQLLLDLLEKRLMQPDANGCENCRDKVRALNKILMFDLTLVFDTYIQSLVSEVERNSQELEEYAHSLEETVRERTAQLEELARHDGLTGLLNQRSLFEELRREIARSSRRSEPFALVYLDADKFKEVNDTLGHKFGDSVLCAVAESFRAVLRPEDTPARYGGDEFCIILPQSDMQGAEAVAQRIIDTFDSTKPECGVTLSIGIVIFAPGSGEDADALLNRADQAMYEAKKGQGYTIHKGQ